MGPTAKVIRDPVTSFIAFAIKLQDLAEPLSADQHFALAWLTDGKIVYLRQNLLILPLLIAKLHYIKLFHQTNVG
jgi:hypothetical protein